MNVTLIGTGLMGYPMAERLTQFHSLAVYNRTKTKAEPLRNLGAAIASTPAEAIVHGQVIILMLADAKAIKEILFSGKKCNLKNKTVIQMGTIASSESIHFKEKISKQGGDYLECPVLGSIKEAREGKLHLMVGASQKQFQQWQEFLKCFGPEPRLIGPVGKGAALKLAMNQLIASHISGFSLSLGLVQRSGISVDDFMAILRKSALYAPMFDNKLPRMINKDYANPNFSTKHMLKDVNLFLKEAKARGLKAKVLEEIRDLLKQTLKNFAEDDYSAVLNIISPKNKFKY